MLAAVLAAGPPGGDAVLTPEEIAREIARCEDLSDAVIDPVATLLALEAEIDGAPDAAERRAMWEELYREMTECMEGDA